MGELVGCGLALWKATMKSLLAD